MDPTMETSPVVNRRGEDRGGAYRAKLLILDRRDRMQKAVESAEPHRTTVHPAPGRPPRRPFGFGQS